jgi:hypothetical protein
MKSVRKRLTFANVMSSIAVFLVVAGGTAFAASQLGKESVGTKQLKKEAVSLAKINKAAKNSLKGATGPAGAKGATGAQGPKGDKGEKGDTGAPGSNVNVGEPLASGKTEYGTIGAESQVAGTVEIAANAQLPIPAPIALENSHVLVAPNSHCTGSSEAPTAAPGFVCIYPYFADAPATGFVWGGEKSRFGFQMSFTSTGVGSAVFGNWAYTAP